VVVDNPGGERAPTVPGRPDPHLGQDVAGVAAAVVEHDVDPAVRSDAHGGKQLAPGARPDAHGDGPRGAPVGRAGHQHVAVIPCAGVPGRVEPPPAGVGREARPRGEVDHDPLRHHHAVGHHDGRSERATSVAGPPRHHPPSGGGRRPALALVGSLVVGHVVAVVQSPHQHRPTRADNHIGVGHPQAGLAHRHGLAERRSAVLGPGQDDRVDARCEPERALGVLGRSLHPRHEHASAVHRHVGVKCLRPGQLDRRPRGLLAVEPLQPDADGLVEPAARRREQHEEAAVGGEGDVGPEAVGGVGRKGEGQRPPRLPARRGERDRAREPGAVDAVGDGHDRRPGRVDGDRR
jgi:hypothetical protein